MCKEKENEVNKFYSSNAGPNTGASFKLALAAFIRECNSIKAYVLLSLPVNPPIG